MWPEPEDPATTERMRAAHTRARAALRANQPPNQPPDHPAGHRPDGRIAWGWRGRTMGAAVSTSDGPAWLRLASAPADQIISTFWDGALDAQRSVPDSVPRPRLLRWHDWTDGPFAYRGELHDYVAAPTVAADAVINSAPDLPPAWWAAARDALDTLTAVSTDRLTIHPAFLAWAMPHYLGIAAHDHFTSRWTTAHGDFHYANLCGADLLILDWDGWGLAPAGYDAAMLHSYSLGAPDAAAHVRRELGHLLHSPAGRSAELVVITELLHAIDQGANLALSAPLRRRAAEILLMPHPARH
jgi:hypothetical protein